MGKCLFMRKGEIHIIGVSLSEFAEGSIITVNENGTPTEFRIEKQGNETALINDEQTLIVPSTATLQADGTLFL